MGGSSPCSDSGIYAFQLSASPSCIFHFRHIGKEEASMNCSWMLLARSRGDISHFLPHSISQTSVTMSYLKAKLNSLLLLVSCKYQFISNFVYFLFFIRLAYHFSTLLCLFSNRLILHQFSPLGIVNRLFILNNSFLQFPSENIGILYPTIWVEYWLYRDFCL